ncbi:MAG: hypothetical protein AB8B52_09225 [Winogradskyella sp.]|uniref:hypothetical protein n=1 Tax=Winogradskyella sp. TaxID=1883156 RepID=UPI00385D7E12
MKNIFLLAIIALCFNSCASILNGRNTVVRVHAPENTTVTYNDETLVVERDETRIFPKRSKDSLRLTLRNDSITTDFAFKRKVSGMIYANLFMPFNYGVGTLIDLTNHNRFTYQRNLYFKIDSTTQSFQTITEKIAPFKQHTTLVYTSPLLAIDVFTQPMASLGVEYFPLDNFSVSAEYANVYSERLRDNIEDKLVKNKGHEFRTELKYYNIVSVFNDPRVNEYFGLEARFIREQFNENLVYSIENDMFAFTVRERVAVNKAVNVFNLKYGINIPIGIGLFLDIYSGFGFRQIVFKNSDNQFNPATDIIRRSSDDFFGIDDRYVEDIDNRELFNFSLGFKFGYKF